jgi:hypothetical protein
MTGDTTELLDVAALLLTGIILGGMGFFAFVFAPLVFTKLPATIAGGFIRQVFPVYYQVFTAVTAFAAVAAWGRIDALILVFVAAAFLSSWLWLMPRINHASDTGSKQFGRLHRLSVAINFAQMAALGIVFVRLGSH